ncbi:unnamed protein product [Aphanomyces euteiches]|uniref:PH domain-containing protein n=1 Tax=Aphanomyces euteiches TaxID=100861 RepID=A0A6G0X4H9_9STRA|nr:hypothetical protein Ae201684_008515 [Aphanomyces euteiches]KAH9085639.1 hypothetical protein Ae201684P_005344 [Aphanomyces euteiches]KAH9143621.1 hypothetical protein AeRB84_012414 [Aphanomyces euteiches]
MSTASRDQQLQVVQAEQALQVDDEWSAERLVLHVKNIVGTIDVQTPLDLKTIALHARNAEYNPRKFSAVIMRLRDPKTTALMFSSGKVVITGASTEANCRLAARKYCKVLQKLNFPAKFHLFKVCNMMGTSDLRFPIRLEGLLNDHSRFCTYEPELFAGLIFKLVDPKLTFLIFVSGKLVICGAKDTNDMHAALEKMYPLLLEYKKRAPAPTLAPVDFQEDADLIEPHSQKNAPHLHLVRPPLHTTLEGFLPDADPFWTVLSCTTLVSRNRMACRAPNVSFLLPLAPPPLEMLQDEPVVSKHDTKAPRSPSHRRSYRLYSLPALNLPQDSSKEDSQRSPTPSKERTPGKEEISLRRMPKLHATRAFRGVVEDEGHASDPGPCDSEDDDDDNRRTLDRTKHVSSYSLYLPDSCSGLKDQFLRIKERFTKPSLSPSRDASTTAKEANAKQRQGGHRRLGASRDAPTSLLLDRQEEIAMKPMELMHELEKLNASAQKLFADDPWSHGAQRWVLEEMHLRGYMTCWTIERGGELVVIIAQTIKSLNASIHPDVALQWIGRQLYGVTIQLPLSRPRELSMEHITVASGIDVALAKMLSLATSSSEPAPSESPPSPPMPPSKPAQTPSMQSTDKTKTPSRDALSSGTQDKNIDPFASIHGRSHARSRSSDAKSIMTTGPTLLSRSLSSDLRGDGTSPEKPHRASLTDKQTPVLRTSVSAVTSSTLPSSTKTYHALATPAAAPLFEDDPFQRCTPDKIGWLRKRSSGLNSWQLRWFELKGNRLYYFKSEKDGIPKGAILLDKVHCVPGDHHTTNELAHSFTIAPSSGDSICMLKFSNRMTYHTYSRRSCTLRVSDDDADDDELHGWINAICRASFHCYLALPPSPPSKKTKQLQHHPMETKKSDNEMYKYSSFQYLRETDPLLWEINPLDQTAIRKKASVATCRADYTLLFSKFATVLKHITLPRPRPISIEQTLRDIIPELFLINNILYGGGETESIDHIFEVLEGYVRRFSPTHDECVHIVSSILQACARTIAGGDSYFVARTLLGSPSMVIRPADNHGVPIVIDISSANPALFTITLQSVFCFHTIDDVDAMREDERLEPVCRVQTLHVQEIDFESTKSTRHLKIRHLLPEEDDSAIDRESHSSRSTDHDYGALLDGLA